MAKKKSNNTTYEFVCEAHDLTNNQEPICYNYIELIGMITKYDTDAYDTKIIAEIVHDYLDKNWKW